jgi:hypothetical protein
MSAPPKHLLQVPQRRTAATNCVVSIAQHPALFLTLDHKTFSVDRRVVSKIS